MEGEADSDCIVGQDWLGTSVSLPVTVAIAIGSAQWGPDRFVTACCSDPDREHDRVVGQAWPVLATPTAAVVHGLDMRGEHGRVRRGHRRRVGDRPQPVGRGG